jgi:CMP/dCMP kinase
VHVSEGRAGDVIGDGSRPLVIAIDGPSGSGKSTTARGVARRLDLAFLDTGAMYRAITWLVLQEGLDSADEPAVARLAGEAELAVNTDPQAPTVAVNGHDVTEAIRHPDVSAAVSAIATNLDVRRELVSRQRELITGATGGIVAEGRDITTVVAPDAQVRVLLVADPAARVARRHAELGERVDAAAVTDQVIRRDHDDSTVAQFHSASPGVVVLDSTSLSLEEVIDAICELAPESHAHRLDGANLAGAGEDVAR